MVHPEGNWGRIAALSALVGLLAAAPAAGSFRPVGGSLNFDASKAVREASIATIGGVPQVAFNEDQNGGFSLLRVRKLDGADWAQVGGALSTAGISTRSPSLANIDGAPWVTATEFVGGDYQTFVTRFDGTNWVRIGGSLNVSATQSSLDPDIVAVFGQVVFGPSTPYVAFGEFDNSRYALHVKRWTGTAWEAVGSTLNQNAGYTAQGMSLVNLAGRFGGTPYVAWRETGQATQTLPKLYVAVLSGSSWSVLGGALNTNNSGSPSLAIVQGTPWVAWTEDNGIARQLRVKRWDSTASAWVQVGAASLNVDPTSEADSPELVNSGGSAYVSFTEQKNFFYRSYVKRFDGTNWVQVGGSLSLDPAKSARVLGLADVLGVPFAAFAQDTAGAAQLRVSRETAPTCQPATVDVPHNSLAFSISLVCDDGVRSIKTSVTHGVLSDFDGLAGTVKYTSAANYSGPDSLTFASSDGSLESAPATVSLNVAAPPGTGGGSGTGGDPPPPPGTPPRLSLLRRTNGVFALGRARTPLTGRTTAARRRPPPRGTTFSFRLDQAATVTVAIGQLRPGRRVGRGCLAPTRARARRPRCQRLVTVATLKRDARAGLNRMAFTGRIGLRALAPGSYRATFTAANAGGRSAPLASAFRIVR
ncbi:MAG: hypothetical protein QOJ97_956 [Solirubrobacteraceae bacterium]|nr:hypothetical protein [Solirubrobacteraceae bacterium]